MSARIIEEIIIASLKKNGYDATSYSNAGIISDNLGVVIWYEDEQYQLEILDSYLENEEE